MEGKHLFQAALLIGVVAAGGMAVWQARRSSEQSSDLRRELGALAASVQKNARGAPAQTVYVLPAAIEPSGNSEATAAAESGPAPDPVRAVARVEGDPGRHAAFIDEVFRGEAVDPTWSRSTQVDLNNALRAVIEQSVVSSVECRSTMCKVVTVHEDSDALLNFSRRAFLSPSTAVWRGATGSEPTGKDSNGRLLYTSYLAKEGTDLPPPPGAGE